RQSIMNLASNYRSNFFIKAGISEDDILSQVWSIIRYLYDDTKIDVHSGEQEALATNEGRNSNRTLKERKLHGTRVDLRFTVYNGTKIAYGEAGCNYEGKKGTKEMKESQLKCPKTLHDMFVSLVKRYIGTKQDLITLGFIMIENYMAVYYF
ncbi:hypothetical protein BDB00DRAFT_767078, partial [Zychaea mexicana]|uniref:uncharacterized protein n=1 Tax=Zychaea mexicana TaxID=64656 RepID=UPI0022FE8F0D